MPDSTQPPPTGLADMPDDPTETAADRVHRSRDTGVWVARWRRGTASAYTFPDELAALRFAISDEGLGREVLWVPHGEDICGYQKPDPRLPADHTEDGA